MNRNKKSSTTKGKKIEKLGLTLLLELRIHQIPRVEAEFLPILITVIVSRRQK